jgi:hypothetical protein
VRMNTTRHGIGIGVRLLVTFHRFGVMIARFPSITSF